MIQSHIYQILILMLFYAFHLYPCNYHTAQLNVRTGSLKVLLCVFRYLGPQSY